MNNDFYRPNKIWFGIWLAIFIVMVLIGSWQANLYMQDDLSKSGKQEFITVTTILPYAIAYLEEQKRPDLLKQITNIDLGPFALVITDRAGNIKYAPQSWPAAKPSVLLKGQKFFYLFKEQSARISLAGPFIDRNGPSASEVPNREGESIGRLYLVAKPPPTWQGTLEQIFQKILSPSESVLLFTLFSYILVLVGFAAICAITARFQSHFQGIHEQQYESELEARNLRIQVLESNMKSADLRLQLLDRSHEKAQTKLGAARNTIAGLEMAIQYESTRNEELQESLRKAVTDRNEAIDTIQAIELDREMITKEQKELEALREVEELNSFEASKEKGRRPKEAFWLNMVYKNLYFSKRALQNIIDLQNSHDIMPSLPDALSTLNNCSVESLLTGDAIPSRTAVRYSQPLDHHNGDFWEYRFSADGRIFFGLSKSKTWNIDTILLKRKFTENRYKYGKYLGETLGKDNEDLKGVDLKMAN